LGKLIDTLAGPAEVKESQDADKTIEGKRAVVFDVALKILIGGIAELGERGTDPWIDGGGRLLIFASEEFAHDRVWLRVHDRPDTNGGIVDREHQIRDLGPERSAQSFNFVYFARVDDVCFLQPQLKVIETVRCGRNLPFPHLGRPFSPQKKRADLTAEMQAEIEQPRIVDGQMRLVVEMPGASGPQEIYISDLSGTFQLCPTERTFTIQDLSGTAHMKGLLCPLHVREATGTFTIQRGDQAVYEAIARTFSQRIWELTPH
jgi:hypothetical protein